MTGLLWLGPRCVRWLLVRSFLRAVGVGRWAELVRMHASPLESGSVDAQDWLPAPARFDALELEGLPAPVQRHFRAVLTVGQPTTLVPARLCLEPFADDHLPGLHAMNTD